MARNWTQEEIETLHVMTRSGKSPDEIAEALGRSRSSVTNKAFQEGTGFVDPRTGKRQKGFIPRTRKVSDKALSKVRPKNAKVRTYPNAIGRVDWAV